MERWHFQLPASVTPARSPARFPFVVVVSVHILVIHIQVVRADFVLDV